MTQFIPATYLMTGIGGIMQRGESIGAELAGGGRAPAHHGGRGFSSRRSLFRWEKEEKLRASAKLWVLVVLLPFFLLGGYQAWSRHDLMKAQILARDLRRGHTWLIQNARIFVGNGKVIESGAVLVRRAERSRKFTKATSPDAKTLNAEPIDAAGKTVLPGLIDVHVHLGAPGGFYEDMSKFDPAKPPSASLQSYLYCGVTAVRSAGDELDDMLKLRQSLSTAAKNSGRELFFCGPLFTPRAVTEPSTRNTCRR